MKSIIFEFSSVLGEYSCCNIFSRTFINFSFLEMKLDIGIHILFHEKSRQTQNSPFFDKSLISLYYQAVYNLKWKLWNIWIRTVHLSDFEKEKYFIRWFFRQRRFDVQKAFLLCLPKRLAQTHCSLFQKAAEAKLCVKKY